MMRFAGAAFILFTLQLTAGISQDQTSKDETGYFTGRITDEAGKPVIGVPVRALQYATDLAGARTLQQFRAVRSDDRGDYRLFALAPGRYYIGVGEVPGDASGQPSDVHYVFRLYPGVRDINQATALEIFPGKATQTDLKAVRQSVESKTPLLDNR